jgi:hypothetical protein
MMTNGTEHVTRTELHDDVVMLIIIIIIINPQNSSSHSMLWQHMHACWFMKMSSGLT